MLTDTTVTIHQSESNNWPLVSPSGLKDISHNALDKRTTNTKSTEWKNGTQISKTISAQTDTGPGETLHKKFSVPHHFFLNFLAIKKIFQIVCNFLSKSIVIRVECRKFEFKTFYIKSFRGPEGHLCLLRSMFQSNHLCLLKDMFSSLKQFHRITFFKELSFSILEKKYVIFKNSF